MLVETELKAPCLLVAVPQLSDPNFARSIILLLEHGDEGSMGLVLNRPVDLDMRDFCHSQDIVYQGSGGGGVFAGGPVQEDRAFILHESDHRGPETEEINDDIALSFSIESLKMLAAAPPEKINVFLGYAGWGDEQLADEVTNGAWLVMPFDPKFIFQIDSTTAWETALEQMGIEPARLVHSGAIH